MLQLKQLRKQANVTQQQIADSLGISRPTYTRYENGEREPSIAALKRIAAFFNISMDELVEFEPAEIVVRANIDNIDALIARMVAELSDDDKLNLKRYIEYIQKRNNG